MKKYVSIIKPIEEPFVVRCDKGQVEELKMLYAPLLVMPDGESVYLNEKQIDLLVKEEIKENIIKHLDTAFDSMRAFEEVTK